MVLSETLWERMEITRRDLIKVSPTMTVLGTLSRPVSAMGDPLPSLNMFSNQHCRTGTLPLLLTLFTCEGLSAQQNLYSNPQNSNQSDNATESLQKATQNPVANLISVPLQDNTNFGIGPFDRNQNVLNIQPAVPIHITSDWNLIIRWITPIIWQPAPGTADLQGYGIVENTPARRLRCIHSVFENVAGAQSSRGLLGLIPSWV
jgi:hypothetical protein